MLIDTLSLKLISLICGININIAIPAETECSVCVILLTTDSYALSDKTKL